MEIIGELGGASACNGRCLKYSEWIFASDRIPSTAAHHVSRATSFCRTGYTFSSWIRAACLVSLLPAFPSTPLSNRPGGPTVSRSEIDYVGAELFNIVKCLADLFISDSGDGVEPVGHDGEDALLGAVGLLHLDDVAHDVLRVLHVHLQQLDRLALRLHLLQHLSVHDLLQSRRPVVLGLLVCGLRSGVLYYHSVQ